MAYITLSFGSQVICQGGLGTVEARSGDTIHYLDLNKAKALSKARTTSSSIITVSVSVPIRYRNAQNHLQCCCFSDILFSERVT